MADGRPIIFLDFDGVLNHFEARKRSPDSWNHLDATAVGRVNRIIERTGAAVVVSSSWRLFERSHGPVVIRLQNILERNGFKGVVIDVTPYLPHSDPKLYAQYAPKHPRGLEIQQWISDNAFAGPFVILDDNDDMLHLSPYLIRTDDARGLLDEHVDAAVKMLERD